MAGTLAVSSAFLGAAVTLGGCGPRGDDPSGGGGGYSPDSVDAAWKNHFEAFGASDLNKIMLDYDDDSEVWLFNDGNNCGIGTPPAPGKPPPAMTQGLAEFKGEAAIRTMFEGLFAQLKPGTVTKVGPWGRLGQSGPTVLSGNGQDGNVFLTWRTEGLTGENKLDYATDTFTFKPNRKIAKQNIVVTQPTATCAAGRAKSQAYCGTAPGTPTKAGVCRAWWGPTVTESPTEGQAIALAVLDIGMMMASYDESSVVQLFDTRTEVYIYFEGLTAIRQMHSDMRAAIFSWDDELPYGIEQRLLEVSEKTNTVMFVFKCTAYEKATMTYVFKNTGDTPKIVRMNMVITTKSPGSTKILV